MGRPPIGKKAMTATERQRRRRKRLASEKAKQERKAKLEEKRAINFARLKARHEKNHQGDEWVSVYIGPPNPPLPDPHDELAEQLLDTIALEPGLSVDGLLAAIARRIGVRNLTLPADHRDTAKPDSIEPEQETQPPHRS